ncbi:MAG: alpha-amlyase [Bacteroides sp. SM23_62]|nr:MAG: alpha-amlyase [Bacteroides sp. SM23_62]
MKTKIFTLSILAWSILIQAHAQINRVEPPFWWTAMKNPQLQLMIYGDQIAGSNVSINHPGVIVKSVSQLDNPNYLFIDLELTPGVPPGSFEIKLSKEEKVTGTYTYELKEREPGSASREGFNSSDVMYLIMPDRFANGDPSNDIVDEMKEKALNRDDRTGRHGGDLKGIINHLDYLSGMGLTAIWLNPVLENDQEQTSYHGYSTTDFYKVDPRLGTNEQYKELGILAREKGIKLIMDMIFNHCGSEHWWMRDMPSHDWINYYPDFVRTNHRRTVNQDPYAAEADRKIMLDGWFVESMPDLNQRNPFMANYLIQNSIWWIEYVGLAGIRMDTYPYPDKHMMAEWNRRVLEEYPDFNIVGEEWSLNPGLVSYWQKGQQNGDGYQGNLPSLMDFPLQHALTTSLLGKSEEWWNDDWVTLYDALASDFLYPDPSNLVIFPDNHDMPRFYMQVGMDVDLYKLGITYILTTRGIPQIFYGSEILMTHTESNDHGHIRKDFPGGWQGDETNGFTGEGLTEKEREMQVFFKTLLNWRKYNPVIHSGKLIHFAPEDAVYVLGRYNKDKAVMIVLNKNRNPIELAPWRFRELIKDHITGTDILSNKSFDLTKDLKLPPVTPLILELN